MSTPYDLHQSIGYQLSLTARLSERGFEARLKPLGLSRIFWAVLVTIENHGVTQPSGIADFIGVDRTATSRALRNMEAAGLIKRRNGTADKRTTKVALTDAGRACLAQSLPLAQKNAARFETKLAPDEAAELRRLLAKLQSGETNAPARL